MSSSIVPAVGSKGPFVSLRVTNPGWIQAARWSVLRYPLSRVDLVIAQQRGLRHRPSTRPASLNPVVASRSADDADTPEHFRRKVRFLAHYEGKVGERVALHREAMPVALDVVYLDAVGEE
ncbi:MAG: hypothetical protein ACI8X5_003128 [Planctomycetota bacterium]|jgi:hypothetical protein